MTWTTYDDSVSYDAAIPYDGVETTPTTGGGGGRMFGGRLPFPEHLPIDEEEELLIWYALEEM
jgi:hypothetical protein